MDGENAPTRFEIYDVYDHTVSSQLVAADFDGLWSAIYYPIEGSGSALSTGFVRLERGRVLSTLHDRIARGHFTLSGGWLDFMYCVERHPECPVIHGFELPGFHVRARFKIVSLDLLDGHSVPSGGESARMTLRRFGSL